MSFKGEITVMSSCTMRSEFKTERPGKIHMWIFLYYVLSLPLYSYGIFSFGLIFLIEGRGILQATLTLNGLLGGILLGLFSLGIFFERANAKVWRRNFLIKLFKFIAPVKNNLNFIRL